MSHLTPFNYQDQPVRVVTIDGEPWFVLADLCKVLDLSNPTMVAERLDSDALSATEVIDSMGRTQLARIASEAGMYQVVFMSRKPEAAAFRRWITADVLPSIRKRGGYLTPEATEAALTDPDFIIRLATELKTERARVAELTPKAEAFDGFISTKGDLSLNEAAKEIARTGVLTGEKRLRSALMVWGWMYRDATGKPRAYQAQIDNGRLAEKAQWHFHPETGEKVLDTPQVRMTAKGMEAARQRLTKEPAA